MMESFRILFPATLLAEISQHAVGERTVLFRGTSRPVEGRFFVHGEIAVARVEPISPLGHGPRIALFAGREDLAPRIGRRILGPAKDRGKNEEEQSKERDPHAIEDCPREEAI